MAAWELALLVPSGDLPLFRQIANTIANDIVRGRLRPGTKLLSSRALASQLGVSRNTVVTAYEELCVQGWIAMEPARGAFILGVPSEPATTAPFPRAAGFDLAPAPPMQVPAPRTPGMLLLLSGVPELRDLPYRQLARAYRSALSGRSARRSLDYAHPQGNLELRTAIAEMMSSLRGIAAPPDAITVVRGSQHGIYLAARALLRPGDVVAIEEIGYQPAWNALELAGATLVPVRVDQDGLDVAALAALCATTPVRAIYTTPHHQHPSTVTLTAARRAQLLALASRRRMIVLEDDYDHDFHYEGRPVLPLASADRAGVVVYFGTLSKSLAPGLRLGYVVAAPDVAQQIAAYRGSFDGQGDHAIERAVALLLEEGEVQRHVRRALKAYRSRRDVLCAALQRRLPQLELTVPAGGMGIWAKADGIDTDAWVRRGLDHGVAFQAGAQFTFGRAPSSYVRLGFSACNEAELEQAVERLVLALPCTGPVQNRETGTAARAAPMRASR
ncbi:MAG TPA: PLP-dependent aminotransferase family protein [Kofleriaceae bacterium]|nr:PLP-dependent aminotransferase family protein [Kofleriaceae bacterium]